MTPWTLEQIAMATGGSVVGPPTVTVRAVGTDTRALSERDTLFVALRGVHDDGHAFLADAAASGAAAALVERELPAGLPLVVVADTWRALRDLAASERQRVAPRAVAVTGSVGKTTVKDLTAAAVGAALRVHAAAGSFNNELGVPLTLLGMQEDTEVVVAEIGARHVGDIAQLAPLVAPDVAVVTAVAPVHLEVFGTIDTVAAAKGELVRSLGADGLAVLNVADTRVAAMAAFAPSVLRVASDDPAADVAAEDVELDDLGRARAVAVTPWGRAPFALPVAGRHHVTNALLAIATACHLGVPLEAAAAALRGSTVSRWRASVERVGPYVLVDDAYNASPTSVAAALETLLAIRTTGVRWAVLGEMAELGPDAASEHRRIGALAARLGVDRLVVVGPAAGPIAEGARAAGGSIAVEHVGDAPAAVDQLRAELAAGDAVLVKASRVAALEHVSDVLRTVEVRG